MIKWRGCEVLIQLVTLVEHVIWQLNVFLDIVSVLSFW